MALQYNIELQYYICVCVQFLQFSCFHLVRSKIIQGFFYCYCFFFVRFGHDYTVILYYIWLLQIHTHTHSHIFVTVFFCGRLPPAALPFAFSISILLLFLLLVFFFFTVFLYLFNGFQKGENLIIVEEKKSIVRVIDVFYCYLSFFLSRSFELSIGSVLYVHV